MCRMLLSAVAVVALIAAAEAANEATSSAPEARWNAVVACADRSDDRTRHACVDDVLRDAGVLTPAQEQRDRRQRFGRSEGAATHDDASPPPQVAEPTSIEFEIAAVTESREGRLTLTTRDGPVWRQSETMSFPKTPATGQILKVQKGPLGNYLCTAGGRTFRCSRSR